MKDEYTKIMKEGGYKVLEKAVFKISNNAVKFLDGITTNDMDKSTNAFLDRFGKLIVLVDQKVISDEVYIVLEEKYKGRFLDHINNYIKFSKTKIEELNINVLHIIGDKIGDITIAKNIGHISLLDNLDAVKHLHKISDDLYEVIRIENNISVQGTDFDNNMFLETGLYDTVSFTKGCYLGQEVIARVHNLGKPPKMLVRILYDNVPDTVTVNGEHVGNITSKCFSYKYNKYLVFAVISKYDQDIDNGTVLRD